MIVYYETSDSARRGVRPRASLDQYGREVAFPSSLVENYNSVKELFVKTMETAGTFKVLFSTVHKRAPRQ